ncbi:three-helix bundle dimerization domain-containing protein [Nocardia sp. NPDC101769]|uniref:three-helix bundle dimerization domain-containing protein n=1 Tax=Nocardia sp. NPDC101769 TaxID=3364333 RepID=UPI0038087B0A
MKADDERQQISELVLRLGRKYSQLTGEAIKVAVGEAHRRFAGRPVRTFVPLLVERIAERTLAADRPARRWARMPKEHGLGYFSRSWKSTRRWWPVGAQQGESAAMTLRTRS